MHVRACIVLHMHTALHASMYYTMQTLFTRGGDLGGLGDGPPKFEVGEGPCIRSPSSAVGCARKYEQSKKRCRQGIVFGNSGFSCEERVIMKFNTVKIRRIWKKKGKIRKTWSMTKKSHQNFGA